MDGGLTDQGQIPGTEDELECGPGPGSPASSLDPAEPFPLSLESMTLASNL